MLVGGKFGGGRRIVRGVFLGVGRIPVGPTGTDVVTPAGAAGVPHSHSPPCIGINVSICTGNSVIIVTFLLEGAAWYVMI
jgi:hypothetical protein